jgi:lipoprotein-releasing system permease protein
MKFELFVAIRYLKAKRKQAVISLITFISIVGVAAGVAALVIALAINAGFREDLQKLLLGAQAHVQLIPKGREGIPDYLDLTKQVEGMDGVVAAAPSFYQQVLIHSEAANKPAILKGVIPEMETKISSLSKIIIKGDLEDFNDYTIVLGDNLANSLGVSVGDRVTVIAPEMTLMPMGAMQRNRGFKVVAIFKSGLFDYDSGWVYVPIAAAQRLFSFGDMASTIEIRVKQSDLDRAPAIGRAIVDKIGHGLDFTDWISLNKPIFQALNLEKLVMFITIGLIVIVAALNIVATLIMMVLEKSRDIAVLMSMGATPRNIRKIFIYQGVVIGVVGTFFGLILGHGISFFADHYRLIHLPPDVYTIAYVPFHANPLDSVVIAAAAIFISFLATLYPSAAAAKLEPVEALRYE